MTFNFKDLSDLSDAALVEYVERAGYAGLADLGRACDEFGPIERIISGAFEVWKRRGFAEAHIAHCPESLKEILRALRDGRVVQIPD